MHRSKRRSQSPLGPWSDSVEESSSHDPLPGEERTEAAIVTPPLSREMPTCQDSVPTNERSLSLPIDTDFVDATFEEDDDSWRFLERHRGFFRSSLGEGTPLNVTPTPEEKLHNLDVDTALLCDALDEDYIDWDRNFSEFFVMDDCSCSASLNSTTKIEPCIPPQFAFALAISDGQPPVAEKNSEQNQNDDEDTKSEQEERSFVSGIRYMDVVFGRGEFANRHPGNIALHKEKKSFQTRYLQARKRKEKTAIAQELVDTMQDKYSSRFLAYDESNEKWYIVQDERVLDKAKQVLRQNITAEERHAKRIRYSTEKSNS